MGRKINLNEKFSKFTDLWSPKVIGTLNNPNDEIRLVKCKGEFPWHHHDDEDEFFLCIKGEFIVRFENEEVKLGKGECVFVPRGVEHQTASIKESQIIYISKKGAVNTGNVNDDKTVENFEAI